jgi:hypothetical protein
MTDDRGCKSRLRTSTCEESAIEREKHVEAVLAVVTRAKERRLSALHSSDEPAEAVETK